jgi:hypothetical protein
MQLRHDIDVTQEHHAAAGKDTNDTVATTEEFIKYAVNYVGCSKRKAKKMGKGGRSSDPAWWLIERCSHDGKGEKAEPHVAVTQGTWDGGVKSLRACRAPSCASPTLTLAALGVALRAVSTMWRWNRARW